MIILHSYILVVTCCRITLSTNVDMETHLSLTITVMSNFTQFISENIFILRFSHCLYYYLLLGISQGTSTGDDHGYSGPLMGILVVQDVQLGVLIAMVPLLCFQTVSGVGFNTLLQSFIILCVTILSLLLMCRIVSQFVIDRLFKYG